MQYINSKFNIAVLLKIGTKIEIFDEEYILKAGREASLSLLIEHLHSKQFEPYEDVLVRSRHKKGYNYTLVFLKELLDFVGLELRAKRENFKYQYSDKAVADEYFLERNVLLYVKNTHLAAYQILCDAYSYRAKRLKTKFIEKKELESTNESQKILFPFIAGIYAGGSSFIGFPSIVEKLRESGISGGYKNYSSINRAFRTNSAKVKYINDIVSGYALQFDVVDKTASHQDDMDYIYKEDVIERGVREFYGDEIDALSELSIKSIGFDDDEAKKVLQEAISHRIEEKTKKTLTVF